MDALAPKRLQIMSWHKNETQLTTKPQSRGDCLLFGPEPDGLPDHVLNDPRLTALVRINMVPGVRSLNLANSAAIATYEAWRQLGFTGSV